VRSGEVRRRNWPSSLRVDASSRSDVPSSPDLMNTTAERLARAAWARASAARTDELLVGVFLSEPTS
jgi:hypothetical protein